MQQSKLFQILPDYICTPDGMAIDQEGNLVLSCPNFADDSLPGCVVKIDKQGSVRKWFDVPVNPAHGLARTMGIAFDGDWNLYLCDNPGWLGRKETDFTGRLLKITADEDGIREWKTVAYGMEHPNGVRIRDGYLYVTQSNLTKVQDPSGKLVSAVYRFALDEENVEVTNTLEDPNLFVTFLTQNPDCQYGADGICFDEAGNLYVGNFGDGAVHKITIEGGRAVKNEVWAKDPEQLTSTDGICAGPDGCFYVADFSANAVARISKDGEVTRIAQSPDTDGLHGELDQPGEPIVWDGKIVVSCFDLVTDPGKVNTAHEMPATMAYLDLE